MARSKGVTEQTDKRVGYMRGRHTFDLPLRLVLSMSLSASQLYGCLQPFSSTSVRNVSVTLNFTERCDNPEQLSVFPLFFLYLSVCVFRYLLILAVILLCNTGWALTGTTARWTST